MGSGGKRERERGGERERRGERWRRLKARRRWEKTSGVAAARVFLQPFSFRSRIRPGLRMRSRDEANETNADKRRRTAIAPLLDREKQVVERIKMKKQKKKTKFTFSPCEALSPPTSTTPLLQALTSHASSRSLPLPWRLRDCGLHTGTRVARQQGVGKARRRREDGYAKERKNSNLEVFFRRRIGAAAFPARRRLLLLSRKPWLRLLMRRGAELSYRPQRTRL